MHYTALRDSANIRSDYLQLPLLDSDNTIFMFYGGWWRWALVRLDGVAYSQMVCVSAFVNLPLHHKVQMFSSGTGSGGWSQKKGCKSVVVVVWLSSLCSL